MDPLPFIECCRPIAGFFGWGRKLVLQREYLTDSWLRVQVCSNGKQRHLVCIYHNAMIIASLHQAPRSDADCSPTAGTPREGQVSILYRIQRAF